MTLIFFPQCLVLQLGNLASSPNSYPAASLDSGLKIPEDLFSCLSVVVWPSLENGKSTGFCSGFSHPSSVFPPNVPKPGDLGCISNYFFPV